ncbi:MAG: oligosaccharide flippase family protein [Bdellovibrionaceae bacterium]|nr:oligosaccharide flippase family protein [Bdellovibrionales bacterium]MCB9255104.1 oligosaccharide flippase family protein [Pseudobdellovibrionaceae bacterium]
MSDKTHFEKTVLLSLGHLGVVVASFLIPIFLSRWLAVELYGTYKQLMLIYLLAMVIGHMGMDNALFYFVKNKPEHRSLFSLNVMFFDSLVAGALCAGLCFFPDVFGQLFNNPDLAKPLPYFALFLFFSIPTQHFEHYLTVLDHIKAAIAVSFIYESLKAAVLIGGFYFFNSMEGVFLALAILTGIKFVTLAGFNLREWWRTPNRAQLSTQYFREQVRFSLPQGLTNLIAFCLKLDKFVISALFSVRQFTIYAVGCFEIPLIGSVSNTMTDLMSFDMVESRSNPERLKYLWHTTLRKVALFQVPVAAFLVFFSEPVIRFVFSDTYAESAPYFRIFTLILLLSGFSPEILFRVFARTGHLLRLQSVAALYTVAAVVASAYFFGPLGALFTKLVCDLCTQVLYSRAASRLLQLKASEYFPWAQVNRIVLVSALGAAMSWLCIAPFQLNVFWQLTMGGSVYAALLAASAIPTGLVMADEVDYLKEKVNRLLRFVPAS